MNIKKSLSDKQTILLLMPSAKYNQDIIKIVKQLSAESVCYVTLNKTFDSLKEIFKKNNIRTDNIVFIDAISQTIRNAPSQTEQCYFVSSPAALTEISLAISKFLKHNFKYLIFDSLTNLLVYQSKAPVAKFISNIVNKVKESNTKAIFYALSIQEQQALIQECGMFVDDIIDLGKKD